jgi:hypothetical protein
VIPRLFLQRRGGGRNAAVLFLLMAMPHALAQTQVEDSRHFVIGPWRVENNVAIIPYELVAGKDSTYEIGIVLKRRSDPSFQLTPKSVSGAVGRGQFVGGMREIRWDYRRDLAQALTGNDYFFALTARTVLEDGGWPWWYYAGGGTAIVGIVVAIAAGSETATPPPPGVTFLPEPPGNRPNP